MSIPFEGFIGESYQYANKYAAIERTVNWITEVNESQSEKKFKFSFSPSPSNAAFSQLPVPAPFNQANRGLVECRGAAYGVNGNTVFEIDGGGNFTSLGSIATDGRPVSMVVNGNGQIFIASAGLGYVLNTFPAITLVPITTDQFLGSSYATFQDGYVIVINPDQFHQFQISGDDDNPLNDATAWNASNFGVLSGQADRLVAIISSREYLRLLGSRRTQIYQNTGPQLIGNVIDTFPFRSYGQTYIETGCGAAFSLVDMGDSLMWIGEDARGQRACWRDLAFQPQRVSNFAVEAFWQSYPRIDDAVAFPYIWNGHLIYQITFPSACDTARNPTSRTWCYDATVSQLVGRPQWHERQFSNAQNFLIGRPEMFHCYAYGKHLVGSNGADGNPGAIYQYSDTTYTDCGTDYTGAQTQRPIVRDRIAPHLFELNKRILYNRIEIEMERGVGLDTGYAADPVLLLRYSDDGGYTWGQEYTLPVGRKGNYNIRVLLNRLGYARDRVFFVRCTDPVAWSIVGAELDITPCTS